MRAPPGHGWAKRAATSPPLLPTAAWARETGTTVRTTEVTRGTPIAGVSETPWHAPPAAPPLEPELQLTAYLYRQQSLYGPRWPGEDNLGRSPRRRDLHPGSTLSCQIQRCGNRSGNFSRLALSCHKVNHRSGGGGGGWGGHAVDHPEPPLWSNCPANRHAAGRPV